MQAGETLTEEEVQRATQILFERGEQLLHVVFDGRYRNEEYRYLASIQPEQLKGRSIHHQELCGLITELVFLLEVAEVYAIPLTLPCLLIPREYLEPNCKRPIELVLLCRIPLTIPADLPTSQQLLKATLDTLQSSLDRLFEGWQQHLLLGNFLEMDASARKCRFKPGGNNYSRYLCGSKLLKQMSVLIAMENLTFASEFRSNRLHYQTMGMHVENELILMRDYDAMKQRDTTTEEELQGLCMSLEKNAKELFYNMGEPVFVETSHAFEPVDTYELCFLLRRNETVVNFEELKKQLLEQPPPTESAEPVELNGDQLEFFVMYSSERQSLELQLYSEVQLSPEKSDFLSVQIAQFSFQLGNINLEVSDKASSSNQKARFLSYRAHSCFINKQPLIQKLLLAMDTLIVVKIIVDSYFQTSQILQDTEPVHRRIEHYLAILNEMHDQLFQKIPKRRLYGRPGQSLPSTQ